jgi:peptidoglycan/xylan/chitin deacetylase (PgdA/CDA1 family)
MNHWLLLIAVLLCLLCGVAFTQSSANPSPISDGSMPDMFVAKDVDGIASDNEITDEEAKISEPEVTVTPTPSPTKAAAKEQKVSPEASTGIWTANGSDWMFLVDGVAFTGWLYDTDGHVYYFDKDGIMQTGWVKSGGKRYYMNLDGIMQTGDVKIGKETYHFLDDGSLEADENSGSGDTADDVSEEDNSENSTDDVSKEDNSEDSADDVSEANNSEDSIPEEEDSSKETPSEKRGSIALTFDDGPSSFTNRLLDCLEENNAKATFFLVGEEVTYFPDEVKRAAELGCEIGNHSYSHTDLTTLDAAGIAEEIGKTDQLLLNLVGHGGTVVRPPYGSVNDTVKQTVGTPMILWSIDTLDWETLDADTTVQTVLDNVKDGDIILMHDIYSTTVDAAQILIPTLIEEGYDLVTIHELAEIKGVTLTTGTTYGEFYLE